MLVTRDIKMIEKVISMTGTNNQRLYRMCKIHGVIVPSSSEKKYLNYYSHMIQDVDVNKLQSHHNLHKTIMNICFANKKNYEKKQIYEVSQFF